MTQALAPVVELLQSLLPIFKFLLGGAVYCCIYGRKSCLTALLTRRCKTKFPTVYITSIYI